MRVSIAGATVVELVIWISIAGLLIVAVSILLGTGIGANRFQFEQVLITEDARRQLELMSDTIRNARNSSGNNWLVAASNNEIHIRTSVDADTDLEEVRYVLENNDLKRGVTQPGEPESLRTVARSIRNQSVSPEQALFQYYTAEGALLDPILATSSTVERVIVSFLVNVSEQQEPNSGQIVTEVKPRAEDTLTLRLWPVSLNLPVDSTSTDEVTVTTTNPGTGEQTSEHITMDQLNDGRLGTYTGDYYTNINYQQNTGTDGTLPGWYAWVGPITLGYDGATVYQKPADKIPEDQLTSCMSSDLGQMLRDCQPRTVTNTSGPAFVKKYFPILTYAQSSGPIDFISAISHTPPAPPPEPSGSVVYINKLTELFVYDPSLGPSSLQNVGDFGTGDMLDIARTNAGEMYGITDNAAADSITSLYTIDPSTGVATYMDDVDITSGNVYTAAGFLSDGRLAIGGTGTMKFITISGGTATPSAPVPISYPGGSVAFSGDLVERGGKIWFLGVLNSSGDYCFETDLAGNTTQIGTAQLGPANTVWGAVCTDASCDTVRIFTQGGETKLVDAATCTTLSTESLPGAWQGATN